MQVSETERGANLVPGGLYLRLPGRIDHKHNERAPEGWLPFEKASDRIE